MTNALKELVEEYELQKKLTDPNQHFTEAERYRIHTEFNAHARNAIPALKALLSQEAELRELLAAERARREKAEEVVDALADALTWASGSDDFNEGGKAREGWLKLGRPAIDAWLEYRTQYPRVEEEQ